MFLHERCFNYTVDNLKERIEFVHISLRIPKSTKDNLERQASRQHTNFNSLASKILLKGASYDTIAEHVNAVTINGLLFTGMLEDAQTEHLEQLGKVLGPKLIKQTFAFLGLEFDLDGLIRYYFDPVSSFSRWYSFSVIGSGSNRKLMFQHQHRSKWSAFLRAYISAIVKAATGIEPRITSDEGLVIAYC
jgi:hypothetical protein